MRAFLTIVVALFGFVLIRLLVNFLPLGAHRGMIAVVVALAAAIAVGLYAWKVLVVIEGLFTHVVVGAFATGAIGFAAGFFGPLIFKPGANQGPLLGIFITGPLGFVVGGIGGFFVWLWKKRRGPTGGRPA
ncbi:MAG TPA: hypothetical protein VLV15_11010 [Dongiaceae bacterium]|nr:hypothetical protein [Dongiaceae bacterium]